MHALSKCTLTLGPKRLHLERFDRICFITVKPLYSYILYKHKINIMANLFLPIIYKYKKIPLHFIITVFISQQCDYRGVRLYFYIAIQRIKTYYLYYFYAYLLYNTVLYFFWLGKIIGDHGGPKINQSFLANWVKSGYFFISIYNTII